MARPASGTYPSAFGTYVDKVEETDLLEAFDNQQATINDFFTSIPPEKHDYAYAPGKWTLKEIMQHLIDSERIFNYRSLCFARNETASLPGFEENEYAENSLASRRTWESLCDELKVVRQATNFLYQSFTEEMLNKQGVANDNPATALALGFATVGHVYHHVYVIETRYLEATESC